MVEMSGASKVSSELSFDCADERAWPPGFRFHPTDEELVLYYLKRKICRKKLKLDMIRETDVYKWDPEELPGQSKLKTGDRQWFFFSPRDRKYPNGARSNRATRQGYWKATGKDRMVTCNSRTVGVKKTLVFYRGRAPSGDRTDWVMHEYTLDEDELKRCQNVKDYYALYKVYKKSGAGPKNGEQYGAPFREENWLDDEYQDVDNNLKALVAVEQHNEVASAENVRTKYSDKDLDDLLKEMMDEPVLLQPLDTDYGYTLSQVGGEDDTVSTLLEPSYADSIYLQPVTVTAGNHQYFNQTSFNVTEYVESRSQIFEAPDATAAMSDAVEAQRFISAEDYLELDDLCLPEPTSSNVEKPIVNTQLEELNGLSEFDLFLDANMFIGEARDADPYTNQFDDHQFPIPSVDEDQVNHPLWNHESHGSSSIVSHQGNRPLSGVEANGSNGSGSLFSSALWSFVESIPSRPASASERPLVNRAFERMSSFSRIRANVRIYAADTGGAAVKKSGGSGAKRGLIMLWAVGGLCGMFGLLVVKYKSLFNKAFGWTS